MTDFRVTLVEQVHDVLCGVERTANGRHRAKDVQALDEAQGDGINYAAFGTVVLKEPEDVVADAGDGSFPASDPTSWSPLSGSPTHKCPTEDENARGETLEPFLAEVGVGCGA